MESACDQPEDLTNKTTNWYLHLKTRHHTGIYAGDQNFDASDQNVTIT